jgi:hypothetical protein
MRDRENAAQFYCDQSESAASIGFVNPAYVSRNIAYYLLLIIENEAPSHIFASLRDASIAIGYINNDNVEPLSSIIDFLEFSPMSSQVDWQSFTISLVEFIIKKSHKSIACDLLAKLIADFIEVNNFINAEDLHPIYPGFNNHIVAEYSISEKTIPYGELGADYFCTDSLD